MPSYFLLEVSTSDPRKQLTCCGAGPPSPLRDGHQSHGIRKNDHRPTRSTSTGAHSRNSQQYSVQSSHPHRYYHTQPQQQPLHPSLQPQQQQIIQVHPPQFPQSWSGTSAADYTYNSSVGALFPQVHSTDANEPTAVPWFWRVLFSFIEEKRC